MFRRFVNNSCQGLVLVDLKNDIFFFKFIPNYFDAKSFFLVSRDLNPQPPDKKERRGVVTNGVEKDRRKVATGLQGLNKSLLG